KREQAPGLDRRGRGWWRGEHELNLDEGLPGWKDDRDGRRRRDVADAGVGHGTLLALRDREDVNSGADALWSHVGDERRHDILVESPALQRTARERDMDTLRPGRRGRERDRLLSRGSCVAGRPPLTEH